MAELHDGNGMRIAFEHGRCVGIQLDEGDGIRIRLYLGSRDQTILATTDGILLTWNQKKQQSDHIRPQVSFDIGSPKRDLDHIKAQ